MKYLRVKNFEKYQHYKDRRPPWIKLYSSLLDDYAFACLQDASKAHLMLLWLLASQSNNRIPYDEKWIARKINTTAPIDLQTLIAQGFLEVEQDASETLAPRKQSAMPETETETETETTSRALSRVEKLEAAVVESESTSSPQRDEPEPSAEKVSPRRKSRNTPSGGDTFRLAPYIDAHTERFPGSTVESSGRYGRTFKRLEERHGAEETLRRWKIMLAVEGKYATPEKLSAHWPEYDSAEKPDPWRHLAGYPDIVDKDGCFTEYGERVTRPESPVRLVG